MKHLIFSCLFLLACVAFFNANAQTQVSGGIYNSTTWTLANSPYLITGPIVVFPGKTLTIEPGVKVMVQADLDPITGVSTTYLEIRGSLVAVGTPTSPIIFTTDSINVGNYVPPYTPYQQWAGIQVKSNQGGNITFNYITIDHATSGIISDGNYGTITLNECTFSNNVTSVQIYANFVLENCTFINNQYALWGDPLNSLTATNCVFEGNYAGIPYYGGGTNLTNCVFNNNEYALGNSAGGALLNCTFTNNMIAMSGNGSGFNLDDCLFQNNETAISTLTNSTILNCDFLNNGLAIGIGDDMSVQECNIKDNQVGVKIFVQSTAGQLIPNVKDNQICNNTLYNVENGTDLNFGLEKNCFCLNDSAAVEASIYDGYDDITRGLFNYAIYDSSCQNILYYVQKVNLGGVSVEENTQTQAFSFYPNPVNDRLFIETQNPASFNSGLSILDLQGKSIKTGLKYENNVLILNVSDLPAGIYFLKEHNTGLTQKFIKA